MKKLLISLVLCLILIALATMPVMAAKDSNNGSVRVPIVGINGLNNGSAMINNELNYDYAYNWWNNVEVSLSFKNLNSNFTYYLFWEGDDNPYHVREISSFTTNSKGNYNWPFEGYFEPGTYTWNFVLASNYIWDGTQFVPDPSTLVCSTVNSTITIFEIPQLPPSP